MLVSSRMPKRRRRSLGPATAIGVLAAFCDRVSDSAIAAALARDASDGQSWQPGGRLPESSAIGNEFGCAWTAGPVTARAWVFAPPVAPERAKRRTS